MLPWPPVSSLRPLDVKGAVVVLLLAALWGGNPVAVKVGLADVPPLRLAWMRLLLGGLTILAYALWTRRAGLLTVRPEEWRAIWSLGILFSVQIGLMNYGIALTTASHSVVLISSYAVHTVLLAHFFIAGDRLTLPKLVGVLLAYAGIVVLFARDFSQGDGGTLLGDLVVAASALLLGERIVYMARAVQKLDPVKLLLGQSAIGTLCFLGASLVWETDIPSRYTGSLAASLFFQGVVVAGFNFVVNAWLLQVYRPSVLAVWSLTSPIWGILIAVAVTGDELTPTLLLSGLLVAVGIGIATRKWGALP
jgi:drug/metabolite transporter (DMT)-like permease